MMAKLKSLGLEGAKRAGEATTRAFRKLLGRQSSPADGSSPSTAHDHSSDNENSTSSSADADNGQSDNKPKENCDEPSSSSTMRIPGRAYDTPTNGTINTMTAQRSQQQQQQKVPQRYLGKENYPPGCTDADADSDAAPLVAPMRKIRLGASERNELEEKQPEEEQPDKEVPEKKGGEVLSEEEKALRADRAKHLVFIEEALDMARLALRTNETPVGCVLVHNGKVIAKGMNATNITRNGTRHAEFMALAALLSYPPKNGSRTKSLKPKVDRKPDDELDDNASTISPLPDEGNEDGSKSHLYPYGQKEIRDARVDRSIIRECTLYVTVEPCVMCASLLRQLGIKKVFFGAVNDKFGGTGGVFSIHANSLPVRDDGQTASSHPQPPPMRLPDGNQVLGTSFPAGGGDGGNVEDGYEIEGGWGRDEAVALLRRFYVQENGRAPVPRKKEGRAARLAAMMEKDDNASVNSGSASGGTLPGGDDLGAPTGALEDKGNFLQAGPAPAPLSDITNTMKIAKPCRQTNEGTWK